MTTPANPATTALAVEAALHKHEAKREQDAEYKTWLLKRAAECDQARAALVELIDAAEWALRQDDAGNMSDTARFNLEAALAEIKGGEK